MYYWLFNTPVCNTVLLSWIIIFTHGSLFLSVKPIRVCPYQNPQSESACFCKKWPQICMICLFISGIYWLYIEGKHPSFKFFWGRPQTPLTLSPHRKALCIKLKSCNTMDFLSAALSCWHLWKSDYKVCTICILQPCCSANYSIGGWRHLFGLPFCTVKKLVA